MFHSADLAVITKSDLAMATEFDRAAVLANLAAVHPGLPVLEVSARSGQGMQGWLDLVTHLPVRQSIR